MQNFGSKKIWPKNAEIWKSRAPPVPANKMCQKNPLSRGGLTNALFLGVNFWPFFWVKFLTNFWQFFDNFLEILEIFLDSKFWPRFWKFSDSKISKKIRLDFDSKFWIQIFWKFWKFDLPIFVQILKIRTSDFWSDLEKSGPPNFGQILTSDSRFDSRFWDPDLTWIRDMYPHAGYQIPLSSSKDASHTCFNLWFHLPKDASCACYQIPLSSSKDASHACFSLWFHLSKDASYACFSLWLHLPKDVTHSRACFNLKLEPKNVCASSVPYVVAKDASHGSHFLRGI